MTEGHTAEHWLGRSVKRKEDDRFLQGKGNYVDDINLPGMLHMSILRSPVAHARIISIDTSAAAALPGVVAVVTGDLLALHAHLVGGQHGLGVAGQGRHPGQVVLGQQLAGDHRHHPGQGGGGRGVDRVDPGVGHRAAQDRHVQHPGQVDVVDVVAPALEEAVVLLALDAPAQPALGRVLFGHLGLPSWRRWWRCRTGASWPSTAPR